MTWWSVEAGPFQPWMESESFNIPDTLGVSDARAKQIRFLIVFVALRLRWRKGVKTDVSRDVLKWIGFFFHFFTNARYCSQVYDSGRGGRKEKKKLSGSTYRCREENEEELKEGGKRGIGERGEDEERPREETARKKRRKGEKKEKKINLLLFWTDIQKKIYIYITSWISFVLLTQKSKKHKKFPFCRDVSLQHESTLAREPSFPLRDGFLWGEKRTKQKPWNEYVIFHHYYHHRIFWGVTVSFIFFFW